MYQLSTTILSMVMISSSALLAANHEPRSVKTQDAVQVQLERGFETLERGWHAYLEAHRTYRWECSEQVTTEGISETCRKDIDNPGYLPVSDWSHVLVPTYTFLPRPPVGMNWSYGVTEQGRYFCVEVLTKEGLITGIAQTLSDTLGNALDSLSGDNFVISDTCGASETSTEQPVSYENLKITYWLHEEPEDIAPATSIDPLPEEEAICAPYSGPQDIHEAWRRSCGYFHADSGRLLCSQAWLFRNYDRGSRMFYEFIDGGAITPCSK